MLQYLSASLRGPAVKVLLTYRELVTRFKERFGPSGKAEVFLAKLRTRRRKQKDWGKMYEN